MPAPVDDFRHYPSHRVFKATVDLPSFMEPLDALRLLWYSAGRLPGRNANCQRFRLPLSQPTLERGGVAGPSPNASTDLQVSKFLPPERLTGGGTGPFPPCGGRSG
jgi:hypothetical protein